MLGQLVLFWAACLLGQIFAVPFNHSSVGGLHSNTSMVADTSSTPYI
jgi:hypothetical protein